MTHPLGLSPDYIKIDKNRRVSPTVTVDTCYTAATELGYSINAFLHKSTRNRAKHLLGKGDVLLGHEVYERIAKDVKDAFLKACETLDNTLKGYETFNSFTKGKYNTYTLMRDIEATKELLEFITQVCVRKPEHIPLSMGEVKMGRKS